MNEKEINEILKELSSINLEEEEPRKTFFQKHRNTIFLALIGGAAGEVRKLLINEKKPSKKFWSLHDTGISSYL